MFNSFEITVHKAGKSRIGEVDFNNLGFGKEVTDNMFVAEYKNGNWIDARIIPFGKLSIAPTALALHYGQTVFEGMKAFRMADSKISIFRMNKHFQRFNASLQRMCMPVIPYELFTESIMQLVRLDEAWCKNIKGTSLYIRPFMIATEERFGVHVSEEYKFMVFIGAVGEYYSKPLRVKVEDRYIRAAKGGTGFAKCGGNYGGAFYSAQQAKIQGFDQVIWTDGSNELNIEESGTMNIVFVIDGVVTTPALSETILDGVTRDSLLNLADNLGYQTAERKISAIALKKYFEEGKIQEAFGTGTAAVTTPIVSINIQGTDYHLPEYTEQSFVTKAQKRLSDIRLGVYPDSYQWNTIIDIQKQNNKKPKSVAAKMLFQQIF
jgi:branched-chain amino acid aminotransferase